MILIAVLTIFPFIFYYLASFNSSRLDYRLIYITGFLLSAAVLRVMINPELNKDYYGYFDLHSFDNPKDIMSFFFSEPYLYLVYKFFELFSSDKKIIFLGIYWFNFLLTNAFFIWLVARKDVAVWKKMVLFVFYYFLFVFVLLRNGSVYLLFACFFYYSYRDKKFKKILFTPFMHLSALAMMVTLLERSKYYFILFFTGILIVLPIIIFYVMPTLADVMAIQRSVSKAYFYSKGIEDISIFHKIHLVFITIVISITFWIYKKKAITPILITTIVFYYISFLVNPVVGFRFSPYVFMAILLFNSNDTGNNQISKRLDIVSFLLFPYFLFTLFDTHTL